MERLLAAAASLRVGNPEEPGITVGPVIDEAAYKRILRIHRDRKIGSDSRLSNTAMCRRKDFSFRQRFSQM